ncbi:hypothetical protein LSAT2_024351 [Lamellibrachia satsuma]|nr:hypothetical protein LSAT2_024351 [Lamellibrachia satsuma]
MAPNQTADHQSDRPYYRILAARRPMHTAETALTRRERCRSLLSSVTGWIGRQTPQRCPAGTNSGDRASGFNMTLPQTSSGLRFLRCDTLN